jgi:hypothetical protein
VKTRIFHLGDYRRATIAQGQDMPDDYFFVNGMRLYPILGYDPKHPHRLYILVLGLLIDEVATASASSVLLRQKIVKKCREDIYHFLSHENGQIAIYDAVNPLAKDRRSLAKEFSKHHIEVHTLEIPV